MAYAVIAIGLLIMLVIAPIAKSQTLFGLGVWAAAIGVIWLVSQIDPG